MTQFPDVLAVSAPPEGGARRLIRWVCTSNPFYVLSAGLFLAGLRISFGAQTEENDTWALTTGLGGYTLLLAVTAFLLVRFCRVWDDARTVLLLVVLMFLATSITFDEVLVIDRDQEFNRGFPCFLGGLLFAIAVSEALLHGIRLRLPLLYRVPYYLILALFFLYPLALSPLLTDWRREDELMWGVFGFSSVAGLVFLTLLPAIRCGPDYIRANGSPWRWPYYPWALFAILGLVVPARAFLLCLSMHPVNLDDFDNMIFGPYFLVPFGLSLTVLLLEIGLVTSRKGVLWTALLLPVGLISLALVGHRPDPIYDRFLALFSDRLGGDPLYLTLLAVAAFYGYAALRGVLLASEGLTAVLVVLAMVGPDSLSQGRLSPPLASPILAAAVLQIAIGHWHRSSWRCLLGGVGLVVGAGLVFPTPLVFHLALGVVLMIGAAFDDRLGRFLRGAAAVSVLLGCLISQATPLPPIGRAIPGASEGYPLIMASLLVVYGQLLGHRLSLGIASLVLLCWLGGAGWSAYGQLRQIIKGLDYLVLSLVLFLVAIFVSLAKGGFLTLVYRSVFPESPPPER
jgi:hypothetical protein